LPKALSFSDLRSDAGDLPSLPRACSAFFGIDMRQLFDFE